MIEIEATQQSAGEIRTHYVDFTNDLPAGITVSTAGAVLAAYPAGGTAALTVGVIASNVVPVTVGTASAAGVYQVNVSGTLSNGDISIARLIIPIQWQAVRATMGDLIRRLRVITNASVKDYSVNGENYWSDGHLQDVLDHYQIIVDFDSLSSMDQRAGSVNVTKLYYHNLKDWENSPVITDSDGGTIASGYTFYPQLGRVVFTADQAGSARTISGTVYNVNLAAAEVWRSKAAYYAEAYDISGDGQSLSRSQLLQNAEKQAQRFESLGASSAGGSGAIYAERGDM